MMSLRSRQILVFSVGWVAYGSTYLLRKPLGVIKADLEKELSFTKTRLGWLDTALLLPYAIMQMTLGPVGDKLGPRKTLGGCLILSALSMVSFGYWSNFYIYFILLFLNGSTQAQCWPSVSKCLGSWFSSKVRNSIFGLFGTCAFAGGIIATGVAVYLQTNHGWRSVYFLPSFVVAGLGVMVLVLFSQPEELHLEVPGKDTSSKKSEEKMSWFQLWRIPAVAEVAMSMFCLKIVRYCMYMWMPMYLLHHLHYSKAQAGLFSTMFEIGGVVGSGMIGLIIDKFFRGSTLKGTLISVLLSATCLTLFTLTTGWGIACNSILMFLAGVFNCGPDMILGGSVPAELGELNGANSAASVVGLVNGFGSLGTFCEGPIVGLLTSYWGWSSLFTFLIGLSLAGALFVLKASYVYSKKVQPLLDPILST